ncbi:hypothetical protein IAU60_002699 [Kwoniella sp. DSM 27419]
MPSIQTSTAYSTLSSASRDDPRHCDESPAQVEVDLSRGLAGTSIGESTDHAELASGSSIHLIPASPSVSESSLTSDETPFDHLASTSPTKSAIASGTSSTKPTALGLRDLVKMHRADRAKSKGASQKGREPGATTISLGSTPGPTMVTPDGEPPVPAYSDVTRSPSSDATGSDVFARQVAIRGWKVVGGRSWTDGGKMGAYVVYDIGIGLRNGGNVNILRRYTDFVRLRAALKAKYPSLEMAIPPLPGKAHFAKFSPKFLEERQPRLQRFLRAVVLHPEMGKGGPGSIIGDWVTGGGS